MQWSISRIAQILRPLACILASTIVVMKVMKAVKSPVLKPRAYRDVKHNFCSCSREKKVKGWKKVVDFKTCRLRFSRKRLTLTP
jgi:hypothetical protein